MFGAGNNPGGSTWGTGGNTNPFGVTPSASASTPPTLFGGQTATTAVFGAPGQATASVFGAPAQTNPTTASVFGAPAQTNPAPAFGAPATASVFGAPAQTNPTTASVFGAQAQTNPAPAFGATATTTLFGAQAQTYPAPAFGATATTTVFGAPAQTNPAPAFGAPATTSVFGAPAQATPSVFGAQAPATTAVFGAPAKAKPTNSSVFGTKTKSNVFISGAAPSQVFGKTFPTAPTTASSTLFGGNTAPTTASSTLFGGNTAPTNPHFGGTTSGTSTFSTTGGFGGSTNIGKTEAKPTPFGGSSSTTAPGFGTTPVFGGVNPTSSATSAGAPVFISGTGGSKPKAFGALGTDTANTASPGAVFGRAHRGSLVGGRTTTSTAGAAFSTTNTAGSSSGLGSSGTASQPPGNVVNRSLFAGRKSTSSSPQFGKPATTAPSTGTNIFGKTTSTTTPATTSVSSVFGGGSLTSSSHKTGSTDSTGFNNPFKSQALTSDAPAQALFGRPGSASPALTQSSQNPFKTAASTSGVVFGKGSSVTSSEDGADKASTSTRAGFRRTTTTSNIFASNDPPKQESVNIFGKTQTNVFGAKDSERTTSGGGDGSSANIFGKSQSSVVFKSDPPKASASTTEHAGTVFGKASISTQGVGSRVVLPKAEAGSSKPAALFGKPTTTTTTTPTTTQATAVAQGTQPRAQEATETTGAVALFGKPAISTFGKAEERRDVEPDRAPKVLFSKPETSEEGREQDSSEEPGKKRIQRRAWKPDGEAQRTGGLFGRALAGATGRSEANPRHRTDGKAARQDVVKKSGGSTRRSPPSAGRPSTSRRWNSLDDLSLHTVLAARSIPTSHSNKVALKKHFSQFGTVTKVYCTPSKNQAVIHFADHESALNSKKNGRVVKPGVPPINLFWKSLAPTKTASFSPEGAVSPEGSASRSRRPEGQKRLFAGPSDVDSELSTMSGSSDAFGVPMRTLDRPTGIQSDPMAGSVGSAPVKHPPRSLVARAGDVERTRDGSREKTRSVSPVNLPVRRGRDGESSKGARTKGREDSPAPTATIGSLDLLKNLIGKKCNNPEERLECLEARDRALRDARAALNAGKDLSRAEAIKGTCMDMCPEIERYLRQTRRRLTIFEIHPESDGRGIVDHARAVKEYSRSSADQDMPLSNELRPTEVLARTMTFILNNIIQLGGDGRWSDWFEYIWSRFRSIRKDITQQQLCDQTSVMLVEQCARFHIYCAERLCEEDPSVFDQAINTENLTKCLQTLKEMYADMWTKHGQRCPNEAEFRAYVVLMNLNEGDILRETQQLRDEIRVNPHVMFALSIHSALNSDNYIRFFKLVRKAPFLDACILHRYFNQMRSRTLLTFIMAYVGPGQTAQFPLEELVRLLAFEDREEAVEFCEQYGLLSEEGNLAVARQSFSHPETAVPVTRAKIVIESRMTVSPSEVIYGGPLPPNEILPPTDSFDEDGLFLPDAATLQEVQEQVSLSTQEVSRGTWQPGPSTWEATTGAAQSRKVQEAPEQPAPQPATQPPQPKLPYSNDAVKEVAKEIFLEVIKEVCHDMSETLYQTCRTFLNMATPITDDLIHQDTDILIRAIVESVVSEERNKVEQAARARAEFSAMKERAINQIQEEMTEEVMGAIVEDVARDQHREVSDKLKEESITRCTQEIIEQLISSQAFSESEEFAQDFFTHDVQHRREMLDQATAATTRLRMRRFFSKWKNELAGRQRLHRAMLGFPAAPSMDSPRERLGRLLPDNQGYDKHKQAVHVGQDAWLTVMPPGELMKNENNLINEILRQNEQQKRNELLARTPVNMCMLTCKPLIEAYNRDVVQKPGANRVSVYWKVVLCLPQVACEEQYHYTEWLTHKLSSPTHHVPPEFHSHLARIISCQSRLVDSASHQQVMVNTSVRLVSGTLLPSDVASLRRERHLQATQALLFVLDAYQSQDPEFWEREKRRLDRILDVVDSQNVSLLVAGPENLAQSSRSALIPRVQSRVKSVHALPFCSDVVNPQASKQVELAVETLVCEASAGLAIKSEWITDYLHTGLQRFFYSKLHNSPFTNGGEESLDQVPSQLVELYNAGVCHLAAAVGDRGLRSVDWPPLEFTHTNPDLPDACWSNLETLDYVRDLITSLTLPNCDVSDLDDDVAWSDACSTTWLYIETVAGETNGTDVFLISRVREVLRKAREVFEDTCYWQTGVSQAQPTALSIPWTKIIRICIDHKLQCLDRLPPNTDLDQLDYTEIKVHYDPALLDHFMAPEDWLDTTRQAPEPSILEQSMRRAAKRKQQASGEDTPCHHSAGRSKSSKSSRQTSPVTDHSISLQLDPTQARLLQVENMAHNILHAITKEKQANQEYEQYLQDILNEGEQPLDPFFPLHGPFI